MAAMNPPATAARRLVLVPAAPRADNIRRYRVARLRLEARDLPRAQRFDHVKRGHD
jgi:hypothetical protein